MICSKAVVNQFTQLLHCLRDNLIVFFCLNLYLLLIFINVSNILKSWSRVQSQFVPLAAHLVDSYMRKKYCIIPQMSGRSVGLMGTRILQGWPCSSTSVSLGPVREPYLPAQCGCFPQMGTGPPSVNLRYSEKWFKEEEKS